MVGAPAPARPRSCTWPSGGPTRSCIQRLGRAPTIAELADEVDASVDEVIEALEAGTAHRATSLDQSLGADEDGDHR